MFIRFLGKDIGIGSALATHPFSICSLPRGKGTAVNQLVFYVRPHGGITRELSTFAREKPGQSIPVMLDGPYGGVSPDVFAGYSRFLLVSGGSGGGATLPLLESVLAGASKIGSGSEENLTNGRGLDVHFIWAVRNPGQ